MTKPSYYYDSDFIKNQAATGKHRNIIGGLWEELGDLQINFLKAQGLSPEHRLLDVGCGSMRLGVKAVPLLDPGNYFGTDLNLDLLKAGYAKEIEPLGLADRLPKRNLAQDSGFHFASLPDRIDYIIATSVFTHLPLNHMKLFLRNLEKKLKAPAKLFFTVFLCEDQGWCSPEIEQKMGIRTRPIRDPYHYSEADILYAASGTNWQFQGIEDWNHPRNQQMVCFTKS